MALKIVEDQYVMTSQDYIAKTPSDNYDGVTLLSMPPMDPGIDSIVCKKCLDQECDCGGVCKHCLDHEKGLHKLDTLSIIIDSLHTDITDYYWEVTSLLDKGYKYIKDLDFRPGTDIAYVLKRNALSRSKEIKDQFDKTILPELKKESNLINSSDEFYHFRFKTSSKLLKKLKEFIKSDKTKTFLHVASSALGLPGFGLIFQPMIDIYKSLRSD